MNRAKDENMRLSQARMDLSKFEIIINMMDLASVGDHQ